MKFIKSLFVCAILAIVTLVGVDTVSAHFNRGVGFNRGFGNHFGGGYGFNRGFGFGGYNRGFGFGYGGYNQSFGFGYGGYGCNYPVVQSYAYAPAYAVAAPLRAPLISYQPACEPLPVATFAAPTCTEYGYAAPQVGYGAGYGAGFGAGYSAPVLVGASNYGFGFGSNYGAFGNGYGSGFGFVRVGNHGYHGHRNSVGFRAGNHFGNHNFGGRGFSVRSGFRR